MRARRPKFIRNISGAHAAISDLLQTGIIRDSPTIRAEKQPDGRYQLRLGGGAGAAPSTLKPIKKWRSTVGRAPRFLSGARAGISAVNDILRAGFVVDSEHVWVEPLHDGSVRLHVRPEFFAMAFGTGSTQSVILMEFGGDVLMEFGGSILME